MLKSQITPNGFAVKYFRSSSANQTNKFIKEVICSKENVEKCIKAMRSSPQIKLSQKEYEKKAAVLIPLCLHDNELSLLFTVRSAKLSTHVRQVSFPGGLRDTPNETWELCALRETEEEIGIQKDQIQIWGTGGMISPAKPPSIMPVVGFVNQFDIRSLKLNKAEVDNCFTVSLRHLCSKENQKFTQFRSGYCVPSFIGAEKRIWGITGLITNLFLAALLPKEVYRHPIKFVSKYRSK